ncbi:MAG TPA: DUF362 domain-containing protein [Chthoniobacterales bacterium]|nr:DUF362 domain-containing protein [Chthoniobacterales bacterium]
MYSVHDPAAIKQFRSNARVVRNMVDRLVLAVSGQSDIAKAWASLVTPEDRIGIKISAAGGELFTTQRDVVNAIVEGLAAAGHKRESIIVWDRDLSRIKGAGYGTESYQLRSVEPRDGYDAEASFTAPLTGKLVWGDLLYIPRKGENPINPDSENTSNASHFAKIVSKQVTKVINVPVMSDNGQAGVAGCLYNMTVPNVDNWRRFLQFGGVGAYAMAEAYHHPIGGKKVVLNIMDGLVASYAGGPQSHPNYSVHHATLLASRDPVAVDALALERIERWRANAKLPPIGERAAHVAMAGQFGLGNADRARIRVQEVSR